jgi:GalNAc5-diNAcBac-PP-undecaprenol beta-1,3-glucosyltransferase
MSSARATVIIPTFDHPGTLPWAVRSVQEQTVTDIRIVVIGDGVNDATRAALAPILTADDRVEFLDRPKTKRYGEEYRDEVIRGSDSPVIVYCGDDDLFHPDHLESMHEALDGVDFAHPLPVFVAPDGSLTVIPTDLSREDVLHWHLNSDVVRNAVSLHGAAHTRESYLRLAHGWRTAPPGLPSDRYMWEQFFTAPGFRGRTAMRATTAKFYAEGRLGLSPAERGAELARYYERMHRPDFAADWAAAVDAEIWDYSVSLVVHSTHLSTQLDKVARDREALRTSWKQP